MNLPPTDGIRVPAEDLRQLVQAIFEKVPIPAEHARLIADLLVDTDQRGVVSHGVTSVRRYVQSYQQGRANPRPQIQVLKEGPVTAALSGDGGLGIVVATRAMRLAIAKAREMGAGIVTTTYHDHIGSAGKYVRMALREDLIGIAFSGRSASPIYPHDATIQSTIQGDPPMAFGMPAGPDHPCFLLDMGSFMLNKASFEEMPDLFFKSIGLSNVANLMSGTLGGQMLPQFDRRNVPFQGADQSGFFLALDIEQFVPLQAFKNNIDYLMEEVNQMQPFPGHAESTLPGGPEWKREQEYAREGIPIAATDIEALEEVAAEFGLAVPWQK